jgi:hypothetical protein
MRVRAIAKEIFGLDTVVWNAEYVVMLYITQTGYERHFSSSDWSAPDQQNVIDNIAKYLTGPKTPGLVLLEHTNSAITIGGFMAVFPLIAANGWSFQSTAELLGAGRVYLNANSSTSDVSKKGVLLNEASSVLSSSTVPPTPSSVYSTSFRRASPTPTARHRSSTVSWLRPSRFGLFLTVALFGLSVLIS